MTGADWNTPSTGSLGVFLNGQAIGSRGRRGERIEDDSFYLLLNAREAAVEFRIPPVLGNCWEVVLDTYDHRASEGTEVPGGGLLALPERSVMVLRRVD